MRVFFSGVSPNDWNDLTGLAILLYFGAPLILPACAVFGRLHEFWLYCFAAIPFLVLCDFGGFAGSPNDVLLLMLSAPVLLLTLAFTILAIARLMKQQIRSVEITKKRWAYLIAVYLLGIIALYLAPFAPGGPGT